MHAVGFYTAVMDLKLNTNQKPLVMGILNVTPDSFSDGGKYSQTNTAVKRALEMLEQGADIIDIGGESSRPGSKKISRQEEIDRVMPVIEQIRNNSDIPISVDTTKASIIKEALKFDVQIINDISSLGDSDSLNILRDKEVYICLMHMKGTPENMQNNPSYNNLIDDIIYY